MLKIQTQNLEQYSRKNNILISGIPVSQNENVRGLTKNLGKIWNIEIQNDDIVAAHRLYLKTKIHDIIIKFGNKDLVSQIVTKSKTNRLKSDGL